MSRPDKASKAQRLLGKGQQHFLSGDIARAEKSLKAAHKMVPDNPDAIMMLGLLYLETGRTNLARQHFNILLESAPDDPDILNNYGVACLLSGNTDSGFSALERAATLAPDNIGFQIDYAKALVDLGRAADAVAVLDPVYSNASNNPDMAINFGEALRLAGDLDRSKAVLETGYAAAPDNPLIINNLAMTISEQGAFEAAVSLLNKAVRISPEMASIHASLASTLRQLGRYDEAVIAARRAVELDPNEPEWSLKLSMILLLLGQYDEGWPYYKSRWQIYQRDGISALRGRLWTGTPLGTETLLLRAEQGPGDQVTFATCLEDVIALKDNGHIILECDPRLVPCFSRTYPEIEVIGQNPDGHLPKYDVVAGLGDLPRHFRKTIEDFNPLKGRKLVADPALHQHWENIFSKLGDGPKVGIAWRGGAEKISLLKRSFDLKALMPVLQVPGCHFINIQYGASGDEITTLLQEHGITVHNWPEVDPLKELENHIAQIATLDLVLQASNTSAHIAGGLHKPVFLAQAFSPYWMWSIDSSTSLWYPHVQQFRATAPGEWDTVMSDMADALNHWISESYSKDD